MGQFVMNSPPSSEPAAYSPTFCSLSYQYSRPESQSPPTYHWCLYSPLSSKQYL